MVQFIKEKQNRNNKVSIESNTVLHTQNTMRTVGCCLQGECDFDTGVSSKIHAHMPRQSL